MATLTPTIKQYLKNQEQSIAVPTVAETKTRKMKGLFDRMEHALWRIALQGVLHHSLLSQLASS
jgi:hypothetical protein